MVTAEALSKHPEQPESESPPSLLMRQADAARFAGVTRPAVGDAYRRGTLRAAALLAPGLKSRRVVPLFDAEAVAAWAERRLRRAA